MRIAREAVPFVVVAAVLAALAWLVAGVWAAAPFVLGLAFTVWFFRDPDRRPPDDPTALISPADGRVIEAGPRRFSIFMNVFDVHVVRSPSAGRVLEAVHHRGRFRAAWHDAASEHNERTCIRLADGGAGLTFTLVAGLVARRIVCPLRPGQTLTAGERVGLIRFGSRVDVDVPAGTQVVVRVGDRVVAGVSVLGRRPARVEGHDRAFPI